jgi:hypothetical protein
MRGIAMKTDSESMDLFCRINVQAEVPHREFVATVARCAGGSCRLNAVRSQTLDISVDENDLYDPAKSRTGKDRWLYFRYALAIDPVEGVGSAEYIESLGALLTCLWSSCMEAVAACDFEDELPRNERRAKWTTA